MVVKGEKQHMSQGSTDALIGVMTVSLFIILLAFFILLNSIAVLDEQKMLSAIGSLLESFGVDSGGYSVIDGTGDKPDLPAFSNELDGRVGHIDFSDLYVADDNLSQEIKILSDPRGSMVRIPAKILFEPSDINLRPSASPFLNRLGDIIHKNKYPIDISGHLDNMPHAEGVGVTNRELSTIRALRVLEYLIKKKSISSDRITALGWGEHRPVASNKTAETRELNRRVDIVFVHKKEKKKPKGWFIFKDFFFKSLE